MSSFFHIYKYNPNNSHRKTVHLISNDFNVSPCCCIASFHHRYMAPSLLQIIQLSRSSKFSKSTWPSASLHVTTTSDIFISTNTYTHAHRISARVNTTVWPHGLLYSFQLWFHHQSLSARQAYGTAGTHTYTLTFSAPMALFSFHSC